MPYDVDLDAVTDSIDLDALLRDIAEAAKPKAKEGTPNAYWDDYEGDVTDLFGMAMVEMDGQEHAIGDADQAFPIQSISKTFALVLAMQKADVAEGVAEELWSRVGVEPSGDPFNSLVQLEHEEGKPRNPHINAGALVVDDVLLDHCGDPKGDFKALLEELCGEELSYDEEVLASSKFSTRNRAIGYLMADFGNLTSPVEEILDVYGHQCAVRMTTRQLARASRFLANKGTDPATDRGILRPPLARRVSALMLTTGTYDSAGQFAFDVGIPCKSGVAGGIIGLVPREAGVCVWSPPLEQSGNSMAGHAALKELTTRIEISVF